MLTIVLASCLLASDNCTNIALATGCFSSEQQCRELGARYIVPAWVILNPDKELRRWICTPSPQYLLHGGKA